MTLKFYIEHFSSHKYNKIQSTYKIIQMTSNKSQSKISKNSMKMEKQPDLEVPLLKKDSVLNPKTFCKKHSTPSKKQFIKFINIYYFQPKLRKKQLPIKTPFLCDICISQMKNIRNSRQAFPYIKSLERFKKQHVESVFRTYSQQNDVESKTQMVKKAEQIFNEEIDKITQSFNKTIQDYKNLFKGIFNTIIEPIKEENFKKFRDGQFDEKVIRQLYSNSQKVEKYSSLFGQNYQETLKYTCEGLKASFQELEKNFKRQLFVSQHLLKKVIITFKTPQGINKLKNMPSNSQSEQNQGGLIWKRIKMMEQERKRQLSRKKQNKQRSENRQKNTSENEEKQQRQIPSSQRKKIPVPERLKFVKKHKIIRRQKLQKPARKFDVHVIGEDYLLNKDELVVLYMVNKTHTGKVYSQEVNQIPRDEFKRKYPVAYKIYQQNKFQKQQCK